MVSANLVENADINTIITLVNLLTVKLLLVKTDITRNVLGTGILAGVNSLIAIRNTIKIFPI